MDDGGRYSYNDASVNQGYEFHTQGFSEEVVEELARGLRDKFGFFCFVRMKDNQASIIVPSQETGAVTRIIEPFVADCMRYKLPRSNN